MYTPAKERYEIMEYNRCGESGLMLPSTKSSTRPTAMA